LFFLAFIFLALISHIFFSLFELGFLKRLLPIADNHSTMGPVAGSVISVWAEGANRWAIFSEVASAVPDIRYWQNLGQIIGLL
jgi:hypothetical protein